MDIREEVNFATHDLNIIARVSQQDIKQYREQIQTFLMRRFVDTLYEELLPHVREAVMKSFNTTELAKVLTGEMSLAINNALGGHKKD